MLHSVIAAALYIQNQTNAHQLVRLTKNTKLLPNGIAVIDFSIRVGHIKNAHAAGDDWYRVMNDAGGVYDKVMEALR